MTTSTNHVPQKAK